MTARRWTSSALAAGGFPRLPTGAGTYNCQPPSTTMVLAASTYDGRGQKALIGRVANAIVGTATEISHYIAGSR